MLRFGLSVMLCLWLAAANAQDIDVDPLDLPVLPPNHAARKEVKRKQLTPPPLPPEDPVDDPTPPPVFFGEEIYLETETIVYVLDYSQSMGNVFERVSYNKVLRRWEKVVIEATRSIKALSPKIKFNIVLFGTNQGCGIASWRRGPVPAAQANKAAAISWLSGYTNAQLLGGATPTGPGVLVGLAMQPGAIVLLTDGYPSDCGVDSGTVPWISHRRQIRINNTKGVKIDVFAMGLEGPYAEEFGKGVASDNGGTYVKVPGSR